MAKKYVYIKDLYALVTKNPKGAEEIKICLKNKNNFFLLSNIKSLLDFETEEERASIIKTVNGYNPASVCNPQHKISGNLVKLTHQPSSQAICFNLLPNVLKQTYITKLLRSCVLSSSNGDVISIKDALRFEKEFNMQTKAFVIAKQKDDAIKENITDTYSKFVEPKDLEN